MKYETESIYSKKDIGYIKEFKTYQQAKRYAITNSLAKDIIEVSLKSLFDENDIPELHEYYKDGKLLIKII